MTNDTLVMQYVILRFDISLKQTGNACCKPCPKRFRHTDERKVAAVTGQDKYMQKQSSHEFMYHQVVEFEFEIAPLFFYNTR